MLYKSFIAAIGKVNDALLKNPNLDIDNPTVVVVDADVEEGAEFKILGEVGAVGSVMTLRDGRIGLVLSRRKENE